MEKEIKKEPETKGVKVFLMSMPCFVDFFTTGKVLHYKVLEGWPADARILAIRSDPFRSNQAEVVQVMVESAEFEKAIGPIEEKDIILQSPPQTESE